MSVSPNKHRGLPRPSALFLAANQPATHEHRNSALCLADSFQSRIPNPESQIPIPPLRPPCAHLAANQMCWSHIVGTKEYPLHNPQSLIPATQRIAFVIFRDAANAAFRVRAMRRNPKDGDTGKVGGQACLSPPLLLCIANLRQQI